jgi:hypothetical protein
MIPEDRIILLSGHIDLDPGRQRALREAVGAGLDWGRILQVSQREQTCCLMYHHFRSLDLERSIPGAVRDAFKSVYYEVCARNTLIISRTKDLLALLNEARVPVILLKGIFLAGSVYPDIGCRPMSDIDILVREKDKTRLAGLLQGFGYGLIGKDPMNDPFGYSSTFEASDKSRLPLSIDAHCTILPSTWLMGLCAHKLDLERVWSRAMPAQFEGTGVRVLSYEHLLIFQSCHGFVHDYQRLIMLVDIEGILRAFKGKLDLEKAGSEAKRFGVDNIVADALERVKKMSDGSSLDTEVLLKKYAPGLSSVRYVFTRTGLFERIRAAFLLGIVFFRVRMARTRFFRR